MNPPTRLNYFDHQFLRVEDFSDEQAYHLGMRRAHNRLLHTYGVARGLAVTYGGGTVHVSDGVAVDGDGREIVLSAGEELPVPPALTPPPGSPDLAAYVVISYGELTTDRTSETGASGDRRREEVPQLSLVEARPTDPATQLVLGRVTIDSSGQVTGSDDGPPEARRRVAGPAAGADLEVRSLTVAGSGGVGIGTAPAPGVSLTVAGVVDAAELRQNGAAVVGSQWSPTASGITYGEGDVGIGAAPAPGVRLKVAGVLDAAELRQNGTAVAASQWTGSAAGIGYSGGNVGIGANPAASGGPALTVGGTAAVAGALTVGAAATVTGALSVGSTATVAGPLTVGGTATLTAAKVDGVLTAGGARGLLVAADGKVGIGVTAPDYALDVNERIRLRGEGASLQSAGVWLYQRGLNADRAFVGMKNDDVVGMSGSVWGLTMRVANGNVGILSDPAPAGGAALTVAGAAAISSGLTAAGGGFTVDAGGSVGIGAAPAAGVRLRVAGAIDATEVRQNGVALSGSLWTTATAGIVYTGGNVGIGVAPSSGARLTVSGNVAITGELTVNGSVLGRQPQEVVATNPVSLDGTSAAATATWQSIGTGMSLSLQPGKYLVRLLLGGVAVTSTEANDVFAEFELLAGSTSIATTTELFKPNVPAGTLIRTIVLERVVEVTAVQTVQAQLSFRSPGANFVGGEKMTLTVSSNGATRTLIAIPL